MLKEPTKEKHVSKSIKIARRFELQAKGNRVLESRTELPLPFSNTSQLKLITPALAAKPTPKPQMSAGPFHASFLANMNPADALERLP
jgi:hypothetical protein